MDISTRISMAEYLSDEQVMKVRFLPGASQFLYRITLFDNKHYILSIGLFYLSEYSHLTQIIELNYDV